VPASTNAPTTSPASSRRPSRFTISYELFVAGGSMASRAKTVCVPFDLATGRPRRMSPAEREFLEPWQE